MSDKLLGTAPDQITESDKERRLKELNDKIGATDTSVEGWLDGYSELRAAVNELERKYPDLPPEEGPIIVDRIVRTCCACPSQWEGRRTDNGREVY